MSIEKKIKIEHYVPRLYLQNFSSDSRKGCLYCFDKSKGRVFMVNCKNIASESYFYDDEKDINQRLEKTLGRYESRLKLVYDKLLDLEDLDKLNVSERVWIASFIAIQLIRTKKYRTFLKNYLTKTAQDIMQTSPEQERKQLQLMTSDGFAKSIHLNTFGDVAKLTRAIQNQKWILLVNGTAIPYWSSDNPVYPPYLAMPWSGMYTPVQMELPISPRLILMLSGLRNSKFLPSKYEIKDNDKIRFLNSLQLCGSYRYVLACCNDFSEAKEIIRRNPSMSDVQRVIEYPFTYDLSEVDLRSSTQDESATV
jgi:hypothetical protein